MGKARERLAQARDLAPARWVAVAVFTSGVVGWLILVLVARQLGPEGYARFSVAWGVYFGLGGVFTGLQQETTRSIRTLSDLPRGRGVLVMDAVLRVAGVFVVLTSLSSFLWGRSTFGEHWPIYVLTLAVGWLTLAIYLSLNGVLAGQGRWGRLAWLIAGDQILRLGLVALVLALTDRLSIIVWAVVGGTLVWIPMLVLADVRRALSAATGQSLGDFARRSAAAMVSTGCAAVLIGGFPFLVKVTSSDPLGASTGALFAAVLLTRSPILLPLYGLRPVLLVWMIARESGLRSWVRRTLLLAGAVGLVLCALAYLVGPVALRAMFGADYVASRLLMASLTFGAVMIMLLTISGLSLIAIDRHAGSTRGWFAALAVSTVVLALPMSLETRSSIALMLGPGCGVVWHLLELNRSVQTE